MEKQYEEKIAVTIYGTDSKGEMFTEDGSTHTVARGWIKLPVRHKMGPAAEIIIFNKTNGSQAEFLLEGQDGGLFKAVLKDLSVDIWEKDFGAPSEPAPDTREHVHLICKVCGSRESVPMGPDAKKRALAGEVMWRHCAHCVGETDWQIETVAAEKGAKAAAAPVPAPTPAATAPPPAPAPAPAAPINWTEQRSSRRIQMKTSVRVRRTNKNIEILAPTNVSRGGISFESRQSYELDEKVFVVMHYREGGEVMETAGSIVRVSKGKDGFSYGVRFDA